MDETQMNHRRQGFMTAVGLLLTHADKTAKDSILGTLASFGDNLHTEIENGQHASIASGEAVNPCPNGTHWDPATGSCVPNE